MQSFFRKIFFTPGLPQMKIAFFFVEKLIITQRLYYTIYCSKHERNYSISVHFRDNLAISLSRSLRYLHFTFDGCGMEKYTGRLGKKS